MKLKCTGLPHPHSNCMVITLGAGKAVTFHKDAIVDLTDAKHRIDPVEVAGIGHGILAKHSKYIQMYNDVVVVPLPTAAPKNKATQATAKKAIANL